MTVTFGYILKQAYENALLTQPEVGRKEAERLIESTLKPLLKTLAEGGEKTFILDAHALSKTESLLAPLAEDACLTHMAKWADSEGIKVEDLSTKEDGPKFRLSWGE